MYKKNKIATGIQLLISGGLLSGMTLMASTAMAQTKSNDADDKVQRIEITGSSIKRMASETALPVTVIKADTFVKEGLTTAEQILDSLGSNQSTQSGSQSVGSGTGGKSSADLRGIGSDKTLVLLNGRRLANHPYTGDSVDLNIIPVAALDRVEILRDGASAIYGTDAIGGVINFITKRSVKAAEITVEGVLPKSSGGDEARINFLAGKGDLDEDGYTVFGVVDWHKQNPLKAVDRSFSKTGVIPSRGMNKLSGNTDPANFFDPISGISGNYSRAAGCNPAQHTFPNNATQCGYDYTSAVDDIPATEQFSFLGKGSWKINGDHTATFEYLHAESINMSRVAATPFYTGAGSLPNMFLNSTSPYYPGNGINPAVPGLSGGPLSINWRAIQSGKREEKDRSKSDRWLVGAEGLIAGWDYNSALTYAKSNASSRLTNGYLIDAGVNNGINNGIINPFGPQSAAGSAYLNSIQLTGELYSAVAKRIGVDFKASREFGKLAGGAMGVAVGAEIARETASYVVNRAVADQATATGAADAQSVSGGRNIGAVFGEFNAPVTKQVELQFAARYDKYSDVGGTFNPKIGIRYQPTKELLFRSSANTGFRAPTLYEKFSPNSITNTSDNYNDPLLCPNGVAVPGQNPSIVCDSQQQIRSGGNTNLLPEKSRSYSIGFVIEPIPEVTFSADYWSVYIRNMIGTLPESVIFGNPVKYANLFVRNGTNQLLYVQATNANLGDMNTDGIDISLSGRLGKTPYGNFLASVDGTYVTTYEYQNELNGPWIQNVGRYGDNSPIFRWKHTLSLTWSNRDWSSTLSQQFLSGYHDQNKQVAAAFFQDVGSYSVWNITATYSGIKNISMTAGIKNIWDTDPPFSNQGTTFQQGYDPRFTNPVGRAWYLRGTYRF